VRRAVALFTLLSVVLLGGCAAKSTAPPVDDGVPSATLPAAWTGPADVSAAAAKAGLPMLTQEILTVHYHAHLDVIVRGVRIAVPAFIGIDQVKQRIAPMHTHDTSGVVHIESATDIPFTLGQFFTEWDQPLTAGRVGPVVLTAGEQLRIYRDGTLVSGDPAALKLTAHAEVVVWVGSATEHPDVPTQYTFAHGL
jgi:hypothetical protein